MNDSFGGTASPSTSSTETVVDRLRTRARTDPERPAFTFLANGEVEESRLTYGELLAAADGIAAALGEWIDDGRLRPDARALLLYPPGLELVTAFLGCLAAGLIAVPAPPPRPHRPQRPHHPESRLASIAADSGATALLTNATLWADREGRFSGPLADLPGLATDALPPRVEAPRKRRIDLAAPAFLQYTSGSTTDPKGVRVSHGNLMANERMLAESWGNEEGSTIVSWLPYYHDMGLVGILLQTIYTGAHAVLLSPQAFLQQPGRWLRAIERYRARFSGAPNFAYELCTQKVGAAERAALDLTCWEVAFSGAEPIRAQTLRRFAEAFAPAGFRLDAFCPGYGLAEATLAVSSCRATGRPRLRAFERAALEQGSARPADFATAGTRDLVGCGPNLSGLTVAIVDPATGAPLPTGEIGEIWVAGPSVATGYWGRPEESAETFGARLAGEGGGLYLRTGDLGFIEGGELYVSGRRKDLILLDGRNLHPQDVEATVEGAHPALRTAGAAAFSVDTDEEERLVVVCEVDRHHVSAGDEELARIAAAIRRAVAEEHDARPWAIRLLRPGALPKTTSGKVQRGACRAAFLSGGWPGLLTGGPSGVPLEAER